MNGKEIVIRSLEFKTPERIPLIFPRSGFSDVVNLQLQWDKNWKPELPIFKFVNSKKPGKFIDEWGSIWETAGMNNMGLVVGHPLEDLEKIGEYKFPDPYSPGRFIEIENNKNFEKYILFWMPLTLFERLYMLHGFEKTLIDLYLDQKKIEKLLNIILDFNLKIIDRIGKEKLDIDGIGITDDWGTNDNLFISIDLWRKIFKEKYKKLFDLIHRYKLKVWMHSDGRINELLPEFIDIGLDVINLNSPKLLGIQEIGKKFKGKLNFFNGVDNQSTLISGSDKDIESEARLIFDFWGSKDGGIIVYFDPDNWEAMGIDKERENMVFNIYKKLMYYYISKI